MTFPLLRGIVNVRYSPMIQWTLAAVLLSQIAAPLQTGVVTGVLRTEGGAPIVGVRVAVAPVEQSEAESVLESIGQTDSSGRYRLENVAPGRYYIVTGPVRAPLYHPGVPETSRATVIVVSAGETVETSDMVSKRTLVTGRVIDATTRAGRRIDSLSLCCEYVFERQAGFLGASYSGRPYQTTVNDDGTFEFSAVPPGVYLLQAVDPEIIATGRRFVVNDEDMAEVEVVVSEGVEMRGIVVDRTGQPVSAASAVLRPKAGNSPFELTSPISRQGGVLTSYGFGAPPATSELVVRVQASSKPRSAPLATDGTFSFSRVLAGNYTLEITSPGSSSLVRELVVGPQAPVEVRLDLPAFQLSGRVIADGGGTLPALTGSVRFVSAAPNAQVVYSYPDASGNFSFLLEPGVYRVFAESLVQGHRVLSISSGSSDLMAQPFVFDGASAPAIQITVAP